MLSYNRYALLQPTNFPNLITKGSPEEVSSLRSLHTLFGQPQVHSLHEVAEAFKSKEYRYEIYQSNVFDLFSANCSGARVIRGA